ncbi:hypothetical protein [Roseburia hominis]|uniref:hypothetical protein n=1 Tax=Roseburia hominis TaxID=301301 RepID=UPI00242C8CB8|nr:hypothetical protein [Roseburia hominis]
MASDVSIRVGVDGANEFKTAIRSINGQMRTLDSEMRALTSGIDNLDDAEAAAGQRMEILQRQAQLTGQRIQTLTAEYDRQVAKLEELGRAQEEAVRSGIESEITRTTNAYNRQQQEVNNLSRQLNNAQADMNRFEQNMRDIENGTDRLTQSFRDTGNAADNMGNSFADAFTAGAVSGAVQSMISGISGLIDSTMEYQRIMASLETSSQHAGYTAAETEASYRQLYQVLGDEQSSATALANLQALGLSQSDLTTLIDASIGAWATYGDSIPIDSLAEAINETAQVGTVTGTFADVLNWAGTSEDEFNDKLAACTTEQERMQLIMDELSRQGLPEMAEAFRENNAALIETNDAQAQMQDAMSKTAEAVMPLAAAITSGLASALDALQPAIQFIVDNIETVVAGIGAFMAVMAVGKIVSFVKEIGSLGGAIMSLAGGPIGLIATAVAAAVAAIVYLWNNCEGFREAITTIGEGIQTAVSTVVEFIKTVFSALVEFFSTIIENIKVGWSGLTEFFTTLFSNISLAIQTAWSGIVTFFSTIAEAVKLVWNGVTEFFTMIFQNAALGVQAAWSEITSFFSSIWAGIQSAFSEVVSFFSNIFTSAKQAVENQWSMITAFFQNIWNGIQSIFSAVASVLGGFFQSAASAVQSAWSGITGFFSGIRSGIQGVFSSVASVLGGFFSSAASAVQSAWSSVVSFFSNIWNNIKNVFNGALSFFRGIGSDIINGLLNGIKAGISKVLSAAKAVVDKVKSVFTGIFGFNTGSPSRWAEQVGEWVDEGLGNGLDGDASVKAASNMVKDIKSAMIDMTNKMNNALLKKENELNEAIAEMDAKAAEEQAAEELATYKKNIADKYEELGKAEKKDKQKVLDEIEKLQDDWNKKQIESQEKAAKEQLQAQLSALQEFQKEYESAIQEIEKSQESMADKLKDIGSLFETIKDDETGEELIEIGNLQDDIDMINAYGDALERLEARGISDSLMDEITGMNVDDAIAYTDQLLNMTDDQYEKYMKLWEQKQEAAEEVARKFYQDEMDAMTEEFIDKIPGELSDVKDEMRTIGVNSIQGMINGINSMSGSLSAAVRRVVDEAISAARSEAEIASPSKKTERLIGKPLAQGVEVGFLDQLASIKNSMASAIMAPFNRVTTTDLYGATAGMVNGMAAAAPTGGMTSTVIIPVNLNGKKIAEVIYDPLKQVGKQRGY